MNPPSHFPVVAFDECPSTQDFGRALSESSSAKPGTPAASALSTPSGTSAAALAALASVASDDRARGFFAVVAKEQTHGRGRNGSTWVQATPAPAATHANSSSSASSAPAWSDSLQNALSAFPDFPPFTLVVPESALAIPPTWVPAATGCAVADALAQTSSFLLSSYPDLPPASGGRGEEHVRLKWPNDLVVRDQRTGTARKLAGILCETSVRGESFSAFLVGIGLNFFAAPEGAGAATSWFWSHFPESVAKKSERSRLNRFLADPACRATVLQRFAQNLERELLEYLAVPRSSGQLRGLALERSLPIGTILSVNKGTVVGRFLGLSETGGLLVEGLAEPVLAGDVQVYDGLASLSGAPNAGAQAGGGAGSGNTASRAPVPSAVPTSHAPGAGKGDKERGKEREARHGAAGSSGPSTHAAPSGAIPAHGTHAAPGSSAHAAAGTAASGETQRPCVILECGNTTVHWEVAVRGESVARGDAGWEEFGRSADDHRATQADPVSLRRPTEALRPLVMALVEHKRASVRVAYSSVSGTSRTRRFVSDLEELLRNVFPEIKLSRNEITSASVLEGTPLAERYDLSALGADRALRFLFCYREAQRLERPVAALGAGTAFTLECVAPDGAILESLIAPGWRMSLDALHENTARLPPLAPESRPRPATGRWNTEDSMQRGAVLPFASVVAALERDKSLARVVVSGGSSEQLADVLASELPQGGLVVERDDELERGVLRSLVASGDLKTGWYLNRACVTPTGAPVAAPPVADAPAGTEPFPMGDGSSPGGPLAEVELDSDEAPIDLSSYRGAIDGRAPAEGVLRTMLKARLLKSKDLALEPRREDFRRLGVRIENVPPEGERLDKWLAEKFKFHNRDTWQQRVEAGELLVQGNSPKVPASHDAPDDGTLRRVKHTYRVKNSDQLWLFHPPEYEPDHIDACEVDFDDGDTVVFSKPGNLVIHASGLYGKNTFLEVARRMGYSDAAPVHRLDRETSGALVCARSSAQRHALSKAFRNGRMKKMYLAVTRPIAGDTVPDVFKVAYPIGPAIGSRIRLKLWIDHPDAQDALTHVVRLAHHDGFDLFACLPQTGRTNQIRIHMSAVGQWIVGDKMYHPDEEVFLRFYEDGLTPWVHERVLFPRHLLHNTGIEALDTGDEGAAAPSGGIWNNPVVANFTDDMVTYEPLRALMEKAGVPEDHGGQAAALVALFRRFAHEEAHVFEDARCYR